MKRIREVLGKKVHKKIWKRSDDAIERVSTLGELYGKKVPKHLKDKPVYVLEVHTFDKEDEKEIHAWLNKEE